MCAHNLHSDMHRGVHTCTLFQVGTAFSLFQPFIGSESIPTANPKSEGRQEGVKKKVII